MPVLYAIAAMSENRVIGNQGKLPWHLPDDFRWFKHKTMGGTLVMGRKTYESIGRPLPGRKTVILSRVPSAPVPEVETYPNIDTLRAAEGLTPILWVCGGGEIYEQLLPFCSVIYLTRVTGNFEGDVFFPAFEDVYALHDVVHKTPEFQVERWFSTRESHLAPRLAREAWPF